MPLYPIGVIDEPTGDGARFSVMPQNGRPAPKEGDSVTVWSQDGQNAPLARFRGEITEINDRTGSFKVMGQEVDPGWPETTEPLGYGNPVYLAQPGSYVPVHNREWASREEYALMLELSKDHQEQAGIRPAGAGFVLLIQEEDSSECDG